MNGWFWTGLTFQIAGGAATVLGLHDSKRVLFPKSFGFSPIAIVRNLKNFVMKLFAPAVARVTKSESRDGAKTSSDSVDTKRKALPTEDDLEALRKYTIDEIEILHERIANACRDWKNDLLEHRKETKQNRRQLENSIDEVQRKIPELVGGKEGRSLDIAAWGVALVTVGTMVSAVGAR